MRRFPWGVLAALFLGFGIGLAYAWIVAPANLVDSKPATLRADFKDQFRTAIAASFAATGNLSRAQARLELLGENDLAGSLNAQAQREIANGQLQQADQLAALALAIATGPNLPLQNTPTFEIFEPAASESTITLSPSPEDIPFDITESPTPGSVANIVDSVETPFIATQPAPNTATPRPTRTPLPTQGAPFRLTALDTVCDSNLPNNLLQVVVFNASQRQMAGIKVVVTWDSGEDIFFTGLKPELGNGYADFVMSPGTIYTVQLGLGSEVSTEITSPTCQVENGESFLGGYKVIFQQP